VNIIVVLGNVVNIKVAIINVVNIKVAKNIQVVNIEVVYMSMLLKLSLMTQTACC
jgi:hypothetical protein